jgi:hypothetical protein
MWENNLFWTLVGCVLGMLTQWFIKGTFWDTKFARGWLLRRQQEKLNAILSKSRLDLTVGSFRIEQIMAQVFEPPLSSSDIECQFEPQQRVLPADLQELEFSYYPERKFRLESQGRIVDDNELYSLKSIRIARPQQQGRRRNQPELVFEPTYFRYYLMTNHSLDDLLLPGLEGGPVSIRQRHNLDLSSFQWSDVKKIPLHQWFATVTGVITSNNQLVIPIRSEMQAIHEPAGGSTWHRASLSCAEGMLRPTDSKTPPPVETPSPFETVFRALEDELGLKRGEHYTEPQVKLIGIGYDKKRCQPIGIFCLELEKPGFLDVYNCWKMAKDRHENMTLMPVAMEPKSVANLLLGRLTYEKRPVHLFSNHQKIGTLLVAFHRLGVKALTDALS